jgi:hypothetical protein
VPRGTYPVAFKVTERIATTVGGVTRTVATSTVCNVCNVCNVLVMVS